MSRTPLVDRFHFLAKPDDGSKTPVVAAVPQVTSGDAEGVAVMRLYDPIDDWGGPWGLSAKEFVQALDELPDDVSEIQLHINSPGGMVWEGLAILNAIRQHRARVVAIVDGLAASAASFIAMGADEVVMAPNSELMIHNPWGFAIGDHTVMTKMAADLQHESRNLADIYRRKAGGDVEDWLAAMAEETWYSAEEAVEAGLADRLLDDAPNDQGDLKARYDLSVFNHAGRRAAPDPRADRAGAHRPAARATAAHRPPAEPEDNTNPNQKGASAMPDKLIEGLRNRLGISADAELDDDGLLAAIDEALAEQAETTPGQTTTAPAGTVLVDQDQYAALQADAAAGRQARDAQLAAERRETVAAAVRDGRIPPAAAERWENLLAADPASGETLASLATGTIPLEARGFTGGVDESADDDAKLYAKTWGAAAETTKEG